MSTRSASMLVWPRRLTENLQVTEPDQSRDRLPRTMLEIQTVLYCTYNNIYSTVALQSSPHKELVPSQEPCKDGEAAMRFARNSTSKVVFRNIIADPISRQRFCHRTSCVPPSSFRFQARSRPDGVELYGNRRVKRCAL